MKPLSFFFSLCLLATAPLYASVENTALIEKMSDKEVVEALELISTSFVDKQSVDAVALRRATLAGLLARLAPNVRLLEKSQIPKSRVPFYEEMLIPRLGYLRLGTLSPTTLVQLDQALVHYHSQGIEALVLDLREADGDDDILLVSEFAQRFIPEGKLLFSVRKAEKETPHISAASHKFASSLVVLINAQTHGAAEALAAALRSRGMFVGTATRGHAVCFEKKEMSKDFVLEIATANIVLPNSQTLFHKGLVPDLSIAQESEALVQIFETSSKNGLKNLLFEPAEQRFNEADLVSRTDSEIDEDRTEQKQPRLYDTVLQRAVDIITALQFFNVGAESPVPPQSKTTIP